MCSRGSALSGGLPNKRPLGGISGACSAWHVFNHPAQPGADAEAASAMTIHPRLLVIMLAAIPLGCSEPETDPALQAAINRADQIAAEGANQTSPAANPFEAYNRTTPKVDPPRPRPDTGELSNVLTAPAPVDSENAEQDAGQ